jgi:hypothetical protein
VKAREPWRSRGLRELEWDVLLDALLTADAEDDGDAGNTLLRIPKDVAVGGLRVDEQSLDDEHDRMASRRDIAARLIEIREWS